MGQEESVPINEDLSPQSLTSRTLEGIASYLKMGRAKKIVVMVGENESDFTTLNISSGISFWTGLDLAFENSLLQKLTSYRLVQASLHQLASRILGLLRQDYMQIWHA
jgi:hypothetical protein